MSSSNSNISPLIYRSQPNPAIHSPGTLATPVELTLFDDGKSHKRHARQLSGNKIADLNRLPGLIIDATEYCACYTVNEEVWTKSKALNSERVFQPYLYLFSVLIAFEWQPTPSTMQRVRIAAKKASDFLYDVTDGFMAIGQVILGGQGLLDVADIQVMASNRFHPRSWISALHEPSKFQPIRVGRGLWRKDQGFVVSWDESDSHRVLVHEWGHYALELVDEYLNLVQIDRSREEQRQWRQMSNVVSIVNSQSKALTDLQTSNKLYIAAPSVAPPIDSIMSTLASSELIPRHGKRRDKQREYMQTKIPEHFPMVDLKDPLEGPAELPLPDLPVFKESLTSNKQEEILLTAADLSDLRSRIIPPSTPNLDFAGSSWVYVLKTSAKNEEDQNRIIGQGVISERDLDEGFLLLGAVISDQVVVVSQIADMRKTPYTSYLKVMCGDIIDDDSEAKRHVRWFDTTPNVPPDFIDVLPAEIRSVTKFDESQLPTKLRVQIETRDPLPEVWISALGQPSTKLVEDRGMPPSTIQPYPDGVARTRWVSDIAELNHLDGHVLLRWNDGAMYICGYSHGGGPCTGGGGRCVCYTAGSYEGNSMVFFRDNYDASDRRGEKILLKKTEKPMDDDEGTRIVSTVMHGGQQYISLSHGATAEARSYIFSLGSNQPLNKHSATLVLYYDDQARRHNGDLLIYRWDGSAGWQRLTTYAPANQSYVCISLDTATPETSGGTNGRTNEYFDRYRIYWTPG